jgi:hypothetical protein
MAKAAKKPTTVRPRMPRKADERALNSSMRELKDPQAVASRDESPEVLVEPTDEEVARRAYEIYVSRGQEPGRHVEDWLQARRELETLRTRASLA